MSYILDLVCRLRAILTENVQSVPLATEPTNEDIAKKFEQEYVRCVRNEKECVCTESNCCDTEQQYPH